MVAMHLLGIFQSCIYTGCETEAVSVSTDDVTVEAIYSSNNTSYVDRKKVNLYVELKSGDWRSTRYSKPNSHVLSSAEANDCAPDYPVFIEFIEKLEIRRQYDENGNEVNAVITDDFVVHTWNY